LRRAAPRCSNTVLRSAVIAALTYSISSGSEASASAGIRMSTGM
jgi:hypothetical protein